MVDLWPPIAVAWRQRGGLVAARPPRLAVRRFRQWRIAVSCGAHGDHSSRLALPLRPELKPSSESECSKQQTHGSFNG